MLRTGFGGRAAGIRQRGGAAKDRRLQGHEWLPNVRAEYERLLNASLERAGYPVRVTAESHRVRMARAEAEGNHEAAEFLRRLPRGRHYGWAVSAQAERLRAAIERVDSELKQHLRAAVAAARDAGVDDGIVAAAQSDDPTTVIALDEATEARRNEIRADALAVGFDEDVFDRFRREAEPDNPDLGWAAVVEATPGPPQSDGCRGVGRPQRVDRHEGRVRGGAGAERGPVGLPEGGDREAGRADRGGGAGGVSRRAGSKEAGSGWAAVVEATRARRGRKGAAESAARRRGDAARDGGPAGARRRLHQRVAERLAYTSGLRNAFRQRAAAHRVAFPDGVALDPALNQADGSHPNETAAEMIASRLWPYVDAAHRRAAARAGRQWAPHTHRECGTDRVLGPNGAPVRRQEDLWRATLAPSFGPAASRRAGGPTTPTATRP